MRESLPEPFSMIRPERETSPEPEVSVLLTMNNATPSCLLEAVRSVLRQSGVSFELILVDQSSRKRTASTLLTAILTHPEVLLFHLPDCGPAAAWNAALLLSRAEFAVMMESDAVMTPGRLQAQTAFLKGAPGVSMVSGQVKYADSDLRPSALNDEGGASIDLRLRQTVGERAEIAFTTICCRKEDVLAVGGILDSDVLQFCCDRDLASRLKSSGYGSVVAENTFCMYRKRPERHKKKGVSAVRAGTTRLKHTSLMPLGEAENRVPLNSIRSKTELAALARNGGVVLDYERIGIRHLEILSAVGELYPRARLNRIGFPPLSSVIIPAFGNPEGLSRVLGQLDAQKSNSFEIIVVSDGCEESEKAALQHRSRKNLRVFNTAYTEGFGAMLARNIGAAQADGKQLIFLDTDMLFRPDFIGGLQRHFLYGHLLFPVIDYVHEKDHSRHLFTDHRRRGRVIAGFLTQCSSVDRESFFSLGGFDLKMLGQGGTDTDFGLRYGIRYGERAQWVGELACQHIGISSGRAYSMGLESRWDRTTLRERKNNGFYIKRHNAVVNDGLKFFTGPPLRNSRKPLLRVVTVVSDYEDFGFTRYLKPSCEHFNLPLEVLYAEPSNIKEQLGGTLAEKDRLLQVFLEDVPADDIVMFVDGYDSLLLAGEKEILNKFKNSGHSLVISAEQNCHPGEPGLKERFPASPTSSKYLNSGGFIARAGYLKWVIRKVRALPIFPAYRNSNQYRWIHLFLEDKGLMKLDTRSSIFHCAATRIEERDTSKWQDQQELFLHRHAIFNHPPFLEEEFRRVMKRIKTDGSRVTCKGSAIQPCVLHFNGPGSVLLKYKEGALSVLRPWEIQENLA